MDPDDVWFGRDPACCAGVDEVGRGALFGPVFAAAVVLTKDSVDPLRRNGLTDSKRLSPRRRALLSPQIREACLAWSIGQSSAAEIDQHGIRDATELAMVRALQRLSWNPELVLVDGVLPLRGWEGPQATLVGGDRRCPSIAAASILAKQERDGLIRRLALRYPGYGLSRHVGYGTALHREAIRKLGPSPLHRRCFLRSLDRTG